MTDKLESQTIPQWQQLATIEQIIAYYKRRTEKENKPQHVLDDA